LVDTVVSGDYCVFCVSGLELHTPKVFFWGGEEEYLAMAERVQSGSVQAQELPSLEIPAGLEQAYLTLHQNRRLLRGFKIAAAMVWMALAGAIGIIIYRDTLWSWGLMGVALVARIVEYAVHRQLPEKLQTSFGLQIVKKEAALYKAMLCYEECRVRLGPRQGDSDARYQGMESSRGFLQYALGALKGGHSSFGHHLRLAENCIEEAQRSPRN